MFNNIISKIAKWKKREKVAPSVIQFNFVDGCNQRCKFCEVPYEPKIPKDELLPDREYYRIIKEAAKLGVDEIRLCGGGEPMYKKKRAMKMIKLTKDNNMKCSIITNGTLFNEKDIKEITKLGVDHIQFSIMGADAATHDYLVGLPGAFDKVIHNVKRFNHWKKILGKEKPFLSFYFIINKSNYKNLNDFKKLLPDTGIGMFGVYDIDIRSEECKKLKLNQKERNEVKEDIMKLEKYIKEEGIDFTYQETIFKKEKAGKNKIQELIKIDKSKKDLLNVPCYEPWYYLGIRGNGSIEICPNIKHKKINMKGRRLKDIWYGDYMDNVRKKVMEKNIEGQCLFCCNIGVTLSIRERLKRNHKNG
jgi:MoaA/NifB/PqqE/SkfB family radical SAM enzyme